MIDEEATYKKFGYYSTDLKLQSHKPIIRICKNCGESKEIIFQQYRDLCQSCSNKQKYNLPKPQILNKEDRYLNNTMIDRILTIEKFGYDPINLKPKSNRMIIAICKECGKIREITFQGYYDLCRLCGKQQEEVRITQSCIIQGINREDFNGFIKNRTKTYILPEIQCIKLNKRFNNSEFHHLSKSIGIYIPGVLHRHIGHNLKTGKNMGEINGITLQYLYGCDY